MARPIPDIGDLSKLDKEIKPKETKSTIDAAFYSLRSKPSNNFVLGSICGWFAGMTVVRVGKIAAFGLGGGILMLHFASEWDYIRVNWERVRQAAGESRKLTERFLSFVRRNSSSSIGFAGGFFFGVASA